MIAAMDEAGVAKSALVQASTSYTHDNSYVADAVAAHRSVSRGSSRGRLRRRRIRAHRLLDEPGIGGPAPIHRRHTAAAKDARLDDPRSFPAWETAGKAGIPVCVQLRAEGLRSS